MTFEKYDLYINACKYQQKYGNLKKVKISLMLWLGEKIKKVEKLYHHS